MLFTAEQAAQKRCDGFCHHQANFTAEQAAQKNVA